MRVFTSRLVHVNVVVAAAQIQAATVHHWPFERSCMEPNINMKQTLVFFKVIKRDGQLWMAEMGRKYYKYAFHYIWENLIQGK